MAVVTIKSLLEAGVHFGHQTRRWNPKMKRYIFEERNGIYIVDLQKTIVQLNEACEVVREMVNNGSSVLFVGTKRQAKEAIYNAATKCGMPYVNERWLGGTLTNNKTIRKSIDRLHELEAMSMEGMFDQLPKKEVASLLREKAKLHKNLDGIKKMKQLPGAVFIIDIKREKIATAEARKTGIPIIAIVDTNCDPDEVDYCIAGNDDAIKSIELISSVISDVIVEVQQEMIKTGEIEEKEEAAPVVEAAEKVKEEILEEGGPKEEVEKEAEAVEEKKVKKVVRKAAAKDVKKTPTKKRVTTPKKTGKEKQKDED